ncbi:MAG: Hsp20/alpha crystallin family protein [Candidatus Thorarchaeota archaeon]
MCDEKHYNPKGFAECFHFRPRDIAKMKHMARHFMRGIMGSHIPFNIEDIGDSYLITVPLAGRTKEDVKVSLINKNLNVKAEKPKIAEYENLKEKEEGSEDVDNFCVPFFGKGFTFVDVNMDIPLPADADTENLISKMANGLLKITIKKTPAKKIDISES